MYLTQTQKKQIEQLENDNFYHPIDLVYHIENAPDDTETIEQLTEHLHDQMAFNIEIIFFHTAINYLKEHDPSLRESFEYAHNLGFTFNTNNISSETLASIHASETALETYHEITDELADILDFTL